MLRSLLIPSRYVSYSFIGNPVKTLSRIWRYSWYQTNSRTSWSSGLRSSWLGGQPPWNSTIQVPITKVPAECVCCCCCKDVLRPTAVRPCGLSLSPDRNTDKVNLREEKYDLQEMSQHEWSNGLFMLLLVSSGVFATHFIKSAFGDNFSHLVVISSCCVWHTGF